MSKFINKIIYSMIAIIILLVVAKAGDTIGLIKWSSMVVNNVENPAKVPYKNKEIDYDQIINKTYNDSDYKPVYYYHQYHKTKDGLLIIKEMIVRGDIVTLSPSQCHWDVINKASTGYTNNLIYCGVGVDYAIIKNHNQTYMVKFEGKDESL